MNVFNGSSIYNAPTIYESGASGGGEGDSRYYETDFSNFDYANFIDIPKEGFLTFYNPNYTLSSDPNGLKITAPSGNVNFPKNLFFYAKNNSKLTFNFLCEANSYDPTFIWFLNGCAFDVNTNEQNTLILLIKDSYTVNPTDKITYYDHNYGLLYYATQVDFRQMNEAEIKFYSDRTELYLNGDKLADIVGNDLTTDLNYNPRNGRYIITNKIKFDY